MPEKKSARPFTPFEERVINFATKPMSALNNWIYRASGGRVGGKFRYGAPIMLLTTRGRKSGQSRTVPLLYVEDGEKLVTVASKAGVSHHPAWFLNLEASPDVEVQIGTVKKAMRARRATPDEKAGYWPRLVQMYPDYDDYQARTKRDIPVVILAPR